MERKELVRMASYSKLAYEDLAQEDSANFQFVDSRATGVQYFVKRKGDTLLIAFRGTDSLRDAITDARFWGATLPDGTRAPKIKVHTGFLTAYRHPEVRGRIRDLVGAVQIRRVRITGHSYGAALALLCAGDLRNLSPGLDVEVVVFGCPRVGNRAFECAYEDLVSKTVRVENGNDAVTKLPPALLGYRHVGEKFHVGGPRIPGVYRTEDHSIDEYIRHLCRCIPKRLPI